MNTVAFFSNLFEGGDLIIILVIVLLLFGAKRLPELARGLGQAVNEFSKAKDDVRRQLSRADEPVVQPPQGIQPRTQDPAPEAPPAAVPPPEAKAAPEEPRTQA